jgi:Tol biopolymer transport system component
MGRSLLVAGLLAAVAAPARGAVPAIVFSSDRNLGLDVVQRYSIEPSGADRRELTQSANSFLSPDGRLAARVGGTANAPTIEISPAAGGAARLVVAGFSEPPGILPGRPSIYWAPNSRLLALLVPRTCAVPSCPGSDLWTVRVDGSRLVRIDLARRPAWSADSRRLAYVRYYDPFSHDTLFVVRADGTGERPLTPGTAPVWSPRGHLIAYGALRGLALVDPDRPGSRRVLARGSMNGADPPAWSPDGRRVAAVIVPSPIRPQPRSIVVADVLSGRSRVAVRASLLSLPTFSTDGKRLAYVTTSATYVAGMPARTYGRSAQVFVVTLFGGAPQQVTNELPWATFSSLTWTPKGRLVYDVSQWHNDRELWAVQPDGSGLTQLTDNLFEDFAPAWSPDGTQIVFERSNAYAPFPTTDKPGLYLLDPATGSERFLTALAPEAFAAPAWAPDGSAIAYILGDTIAFVRPDGTFLRNMSALGRPQHPTWSPDSARIAFSDDAPAHLSELYVMTRDGSGLRQITDFDYASDPAWSPDGQWIAFYGSLTDRSPAAIWIVHPDGSDPQLIARTLTNGSVAVAWSPDSTRIVYPTRAPGPGTELHTVAINDGSDTVLTASHGSNDTPTWRP